MPAATSATLWAITPIAGADLGAKSSTPAFAALTRLNANDGHVYIYVKASETLGSIDTIKIGTAGSASSDSGSAGWTLNAPGGLTTGQYAWAKRTTLA